MNANAERCLRQIKTYWPLVLILIIAIIVSFIIIYTNVSSPPLFVYYFGETKTLGNSSSISSSPQIASSGNNTYIVWSNSGPGNGVINMEKISRNIDRPTTVVNLSNNSRNSTNPEVTASGDNVYVVWEDSNGTKGGNADIFFSSSRDKGSSFDEPINLSKNNPNSTNPEVTASGDNVYVTWIEKVEKQNNFKIILKTSTDNGTHFTDKKTIKKDIDNKFHFPQIAAFGNNVYLVWADKDPKEGQPNNFKVTLKISTDNGTHFTDKKTIKKDIDNKMHLPQIAAFGNNVYLVWADSNGTTGGNGSIIFSSSRDKGKSFNEPINLSNNSGNSTNPELAASGSNSYVLWSNSSSDNQVIKYKHINTVTLDS